MGDHEDGDGQQGCRPISLLVKQLNDKRKYWKKQKEKTPKYRLSVINV